MKRAVDFCYDLGRASNTLESFFKGFVYFLMLRHVKERNHLDLQFKEWKKDFDYFMSRITENK